MWRDVRVGGEGSGDEGEEFRSVVYDRLPRPQTHPLGTILASYSVEQQERMVRENPRCRSSFTRNRRTRLGGGALSALSYALSVRSATSAQLYMSRTWW